MKKKDKRIIQKILTVSLLILMNIIFCCMPVSAGTPYTGSPKQYYLGNIIRPLADGELGNTSAAYESSFHFEFTANGAGQTHVEEMRVKPRYARSIRWGQPKVICCNSCTNWASNPGIYDIQIFLEDDNGNEYIRKNGYELTGADLQSTGIDFENLDYPLRVGLEIKQNPGTHCPYCERNIGELIIVDGLIWEVTCIDFSHHPQTVSAQYGGSVQFSVGLNKYRDVYGRSLNNYKWETRCNGGEWLQINDGAVGDGTVYGGSDTDCLTVANIGRELYGSEFRCVLTGANSTKAYSMAAGLSLPIYNPVPTLPPDVTPVAAITPAPGSDTSYKPSASSSAYVSGNSSSSNSSTSVPGSSHEERKGEDTFKGDIILPGGGSTDKKISATEVPVGGNSGSSPDAKKNSSSSGRYIPAQNSQKGSSTTKSNLRPGANYVMKNGVLYIVDDEDPSVGVAKEEGKENETEVTEVESEYSADDLAIEGDLYSAELENGFWTTPIGWAAIGILALLVLTLLLLILFFGVVVCGEVEEHDEVFELCGIRLMRWHDKEWHVNLGCAFDENAVLKLHTGLLFAAIFGEWDITGDSKGLYDGSVSAPCERGMLLYRKNIRRKV